MYICKDHIHEHWPWSDNGDVPGSYTRSLGLRETIHLLFPMCMCASFSVGAQEQTETHSLETVWAGDNQS